MIDWEGISLSISQGTGRPFVLEKQQSVGGGSINSCYVISGSGHQFFLKLNNINRLSMFEAEAEGLQAMAATETIRVPAVIAYGRCASHSFLVLEYISLSGRGSDEQLGQQLAAMHRHTQAHYGWHRDNTIGSTMQCNTPTDHWLEFWREQRLAYQYRLAQNNGYARSLVGMERLLSSLDVFFKDYHPVASMLHGDLWSGNYGFAQNGAPVLFDPAFYYGDRETDLAMTELFGGFSQGFYRAYEQAWPLDDAYQQRKTLYNLYHVLNHVNLFGSGYLGQAQGMLERLLEQL